MVTARLVVDADVARAHVPYQFKDVVKSMPERRWLKDLKVWVVPTSYVNMLADALRVAGVTVYVTQANGTPWTGGSPRHGVRDTPGVGWADALFAAVGPDHAEAVYRALSKTLHPDTGNGDTALMQELNAARTRLKPRKAERPW